jgi:hypothetical protein
MEQRKFPHEALPMGAFPFANIFSRFAFATIDTLCAIF